MISMEANNVKLTARLLLALYGNDVVFDDPLNIDRFVSNADLQDGSCWREILLGVRGFAPTAKPASLH
jgi:hypothetical protein